MKVCEFDHVLQRYVAVRPTVPPNVRNPVRHQYYQILRKARLYLRIQPGFDPYVDQGDEADAGAIRQPLCHLFRRVWLGLKTNGKFDYRQEMLRYWAQALEQPLERIRLEADYQLIGGYEQPSRTFTFNIECAELALQQEQLGNLIAHELAHAWHDTQSHSNIRLHGPATDGSEQEADALATDWGYDMLALQHWRAENHRQIGIYTGQIPRPIPVFDPSFLDQL